MLELAANILTFDDIINLWLAKIEKLSNSKTIFITFIGVLQKEINFTDAKICPSGGIGRRAGFKIQ